MAKHIAIKTECRVVPVRFQRAVIGPPDRRYPDIDERGFNHIIPAMNNLPASTAVRGNAVSIAHNHEVEIQLVREDIDDNAMLYVSSSDNNVFTVESPTVNQPCTPGKTCNIRLRTQYVLNWTPAVANLQVHYQKKDGPVIARLVVYVMPLMSVNVQPHIVAINSKTAPGMPPKITFDPIAKLAADIWFNAGVDLSFAKTKLLAVNASGTNYLKFNEVDLVLKHHWTAGYINVYVVQELEDALGYGFSTNDYKGYKLSHPGVFLGLQTNGGSSLDRSNDVVFCANDIAHEIGHFFTLRHPSDGPDNNIPGWGRFDSWSMRFLMHNWNTTRRSRSATPHKGADWPEFNTFGYGSGAHGAYRGAAIPLKAINTGKACIDGHCAIVRNHIAKGANNLYGT